VYKRLIIAGCCLVVSLGLLAGCGGGDEEDGPSRAAFIRDANAICFKANSKAGAKFVTSYEDPRWENVSDNEGRKLEGEIFIPILVQEAKAQQEGISALGVPSGEEEKVETLIKAYEAWLKEAEEQPVKVAIANNMYNHARELAGKMGLDKCEQTPFEEPYSSTEQAGN
jgi:hypothetical protein